MFEVRFKVSPSIVKKLKEKYCDSCKICNGKRLVFVNGQEQKCNCVLAFNTEYGLYSLNIPPKFHKLTRDDIDPNFIEQNEDMKYILQYDKKLDSAYEKGTGLFICGTNGSGKSFIASLILQHASREGYTGYFILQRDLINTAFEAMYNVAVRDDLEKLITEIDFLVIDEIDKLFVDNDDKVQNLLEALLKKRSYSSKPLIVTSNQLMQDLPHTLGQTIVATFEEDLIEVKLTGNYRPRLKEKRNKEFFDEI